jgi:hypothetical protein
MPQPSYLFLGPNRPFLRLAQDLVQQTSIRAFYVTENQELDDTVADSVAILGNHYDFSHGRYINVDWTTRTTSTIAVQEQWGQLLGMMDRLDALDRRHSLGERIRLLQLITSYWDRVLATHEIVGVVFSNIPHEIYDYVVYVLAKAHGIRVMIFHQTQIRGLVAVNSSLDSIGITSDGYFLLHGTGVPSPNAREILLDLDKRLSGVSPWYIKHESLDSWRVDAKWIASRLKTLPSPQRLSSEIRRRRHRGLIYRNTLGRNQAEWDSLVERQPLDLEAPYVLFPLQYHPETTTYPLAGRLADPFEALLRLRSVYPREVQIAVSEHPMQYLRPREQGTYTHLSQVSSVRFIPSSDSSVQYLPDALLVATHGGTIGWEAVSKKKPVLTFSGCFYREAPGVQTINEFDGLDLQVDSNGLSDWIENLANSLFHGVIDETYLVEFEEDEIPLIREKTDRNLRLIVDQWIREFPN